ncbi:MAG: DUF3088 family protein [Kofleriaceae bacterium]
MKDTLFVLRPNFDDAGVTYFCPYSAQVVGFLSYYPQLRDTVDVIELAFAKPRHPLVDLLDAAHQSAPMLVLGGPARSVPSVPNVKVGEINGRPYVEKTIEILRYLAVTRNLPVPH